MAKYGYKHVTAFKNARNVPVKVFDAIIANESSWKMKKRVLLHAECPIHIRDMYRNDKKWYKRFVAIFSKNAPPGYTAHALKDPDSRVRSCYLKPLHKSISDFLKKLDVLDG